MIRLRGVRKAFPLPGGGANVALDGIDLDIEDGEFVVVIGTNGSGKSTLLGTLAGSVRPDTGTLEMEGLDVTQESEPTRARQVARVFQNPLLGTCPTLTVAENLRIAETRGLRRGLRKALDRGALERYGAALRECGLGLENRINALTGDLSGGQRQALTLVMASLRTPKMLLLDEHTAALDPEAAEATMRLTAKIVNGGITTLMVTHSMAQAIAYGDRLLIIHKGRLVEEIRERDSMRSEDLTARFAALYRIKPSIPGQD
ncbi:ABC transporter ATP-binding protein [soil metagenome]